MTNQAITPANLHGAPIVYPENHDIRVIDRPQNEPSNMDLSTDSVVFTAFISDDDCHALMHRLLQQTDVTNTQLLDQITSELFVRGLLPETVQTVHDLDAYHQYTNFFPYNFY